MPLGGGAKQQDDGLMTVAAVEHSIGMVLGQTEVADKTNEIIAVCMLSIERHRRGRTLPIG